MRNFMKSTCMAFLALALVIPAFCSAQSLPPIDTSGSPSGIVALPTHVPAVFRDTFAKYTKLTAPNGRAIHILAQARVTNAQLIRAREVLRFYLSDVAGSEYGSNKARVADAMADRDATLVYFNHESAAEAAFEGALGEVDLAMQDLYATESPVEGSRAYLDNSTRDATFEEIFHLVHDQGVIPALPAFQREIRAATDAAMAAGTWEANPEWIAEGSTTQEYVISVFDVYMGLWAHDPDGDGTSFGGEYQVHNRAALRRNDPSGFALMPKFHPPHLTYMARIDAGFSGTFSLARDPALAYTLKSRYLTHAALTGKKSSGLRGNARSNRLLGNLGDNRLEGGPGNDRLVGRAGSDTAVYSGALAEYTIRRTGALTRVRDRVPGRDGHDTVSSVEFLEFRDATLTVDRR